MRVTTNNHKTTFVENFMGYIFVYIPKCTTISTKKCLTSLTKKSAVISETLGVTNNTHNNIFLKNFMDYTFVYM